MQYAKGRVKITRLTEALAGDVARLWRASVPEEDRCRWKASGRPTTRQTLKERVLDNPEFVPAGSFVALLEGRVLGFCLVCAPGSRPHTGFLCALAVAAQHRRRGIGSRLIALAEGYLAGLGVRRIQVGFEGNPLALLPGVPSNSDAYSFLINRGFRSYERNLLLVMRQETCYFRRPAAVEERERKLAREGIEIRRLGGGERRLLDGFLARHFPEWRHGINNALDWQPPPATIVTVRAGRILGFGGPYSVQPSGKGNFFALGVAPSARRRGIGAVLLNRMCAELRAGGARFTVLTTGLANPAQEIYARAGFRTRYVVDVGMVKVIG